QGGPLIRVRPEQLKAAGIQRVPRVAGVRDGRPLLEDGRVLQVSNVIWATGFIPVSNGSTFRSPETRMASLFKCAVSSRASRGSTLWDCISFTLFRRR